MSQNIRSSFRQEAIDIPDDENLAIIKDTSELLYSLSKSDISAAKTLAYIPKMLAIANLSTLFRFYELEKYLLRSRIQPNLTVLSGSGARIDEVLAFKSNGRDNIVSADPSPSYPAGISSLDLHTLRVEHKVHNKAKSISLPLNGIVLTNDSHNELMETFGPKGVDELAIIRLDPDTLLESGSFADAQSDDERMISLVFAIYNLTKLLTMIKDGGEATITVGLGNSAVEIQSRRTLIYSFYELCLATGVECKLLGSPWLDLFNEQVGVPSMKNPIMRGILSSASLEGIRITGSSNLQNLKSMMKMSFFQRTLYKSIFNGIQRAEDYKLVETLKFDFKE